MTAKHYTALTLVQKGNLPTRKVVGYAADSPASAFRVLFPDYYIRAFNGITLYPKKERASNALEINALEPLEGITAPTAFYQGHKSIEPAFRDDLITETEIRRMLAHIDEGERLGYSQTNNHERVHDRQILREILRQYL
ncbi:MAG TPA: hypothetical protein VJK51_02215 [Candidatus Nanoarchaeia archaeon]|nr:hypothetical protein [Candidatus Nanoarchaeia archaeon]